MKYKVKARVGKVDQFVSFVPNKNGVNEELIVNNVEAESELEAIWDTIDYIAESINRKDNPLFPYATAITTLDSVYVFDDWEKAEYAIVKNDYSNALEVYTWFEAEEI